MTALRAHNATIDFPADGGCGCSVGGSPGVLLLLFVGGVMNLYVIAALSTVVAVEKTSRLGELGSRVSGGVLIALAIWILRG